MASTIKTKSSNVASKVPTDAQLATGELALNFPDKKLYTKNPNGDVILIASGTTVAYVDTSFTATASQTTFTVDYTVGGVDVYLNGIKLDSGDFTATNGSTIVLTTGTLVNNIVEVYKYINAFTANNALRELNGCIAPVTKLSGPGLGLMSRKAFEKLKTLVYQALDNTESVELIVE